MFAVGVQCVGVNCRKTATMLDNCQLCCSIIVTHLVVDKTIPKHTRHCTVVSCVGMPWPYLAIMLCCPHNHITLHHSGIDYRQVPLIGAGCFRQVAAFTVTTIDRFHHMQRSPRQQDSQPSSLQGSHFETPTVKRNHSVQREVWRLHSLSAFSEKPSIYTVPSEGENQRIHILYLLSIKSPNPCA